MARIYHRILDLHRDFCHYRLRNKLLVSCHIINYLLLTCYLSVCLSVRLFALSRLNRLTYDLHLVHGGRH